MSQPLDANKVKNLSLGLREALDRPQHAAAAVVGVSERTVQRRLNRARLLLAEQLDDLRPATSSEPALPPGDTPAP